MDPARTGDTSRSSERAFKDCWCEAPEHRQQRGGQTREWLWDLTWYNVNESKSFVRPEVIIEHENHLGDVAFLDDLWKVLCGFAPLRVMIGYTRSTQEALEKRQLAVRNAVEGWTFPEDVADLVILRRYGEPQWQVLERDPGAHTFTLRSAANV